MEDLNHKFISATYEMYEVGEGTQPLLEAATEERPMVIMTDFGMLPLTAFEDKLKVLATGEEFDITLNPEEAFGEYVAERVVDLDKQIFSVDGVFDEVHIREGVIVPLQNEQGQRFMAQIAKIGDTTVTVDLNHPLAGKSLRFKGRILESHDATEDEIMAMLNQMNHHGCGGGGCSGSCGNCGEGGCGGNCGEGGCGGCH